MNTKAFVEWFRNASPYIHAHQGSIFVINFGGEALLESNFSNLIHDLSLLHGLGIHLVLVHGARPQIESRLQQRNATLQCAQGLRITDSIALESVKEAAGIVRVELEALFSMGLANSPMAGVQIRIASGNFVTAQPLGVKNGIDYQHTGIVRRIDKDGIRQRLDVGTIVLIPPIGYSPTGEVFNLSSQDLASICAIELQADKLIHLVEDPLPKNSTGQHLIHVTPYELEQMLAQPDLSENLRLHLQAGLKACDKVARVHFLQRQVDGILLQELFTKDGAGILLTTGPYETTRIACIADIAGILELLGPLESQGILVQRTRELLETEIESFIVMERDGMILGCAALYPYFKEDMAELACFAIHEAYRQDGRGTRLLEQAEQQALNLCVEHIFVLTTQTVHWFLERGFLETTLENLPIQKQSSHNYTRGSKMLIKSLVS